MKILILGVNGFIGHSLTNYILENTDWQISGIDLSDNRIKHRLGDPDFEFLLGDITQNRDWIDHQIETSDIVIPLAAIANPINYVKVPLKVFEIVFEENLWVIKRCAYHGVRLIFPSTSEVYGMCQDESFDERTSPLVLGPVCKDRWIYASAKQLLDRVIWAYGAQDLQFTIFRPFNWIGPNLDDINATCKGGSRVAIQFLGNLLRREPLLLVNGGKQRRTFTYIDDGIDALIRIIRNEGGVANGSVYNIGNPANVCSISDLASTMVEVLSSFPGYEDSCQSAVIEFIPSFEYFGPGYQDVEHRKPDIESIRADLGWQPQVGLEEAVRRLIAFYIHQFEERNEGNLVQGYV
jgi:nucleoside-diphosphate-sugar epimerase